MDGGNSNENAPARVIEAEACIPIDVTIYTVPVIFRTCYAFTDKAYLWIEPGAVDTVTVGLRRKSKEDDLTAMVGSFSNALIDFAVRADVQSRTSDIRSTIVKAALGEVAANVSAN